MTRDYTRQSAGAASGGASAGAAAKAPDNTVHHPPLILFGIGSGGCGAGCLTNLWQIFTTFFALWIMFNVATSGQINFTFWQKQPIIAAICLLIACCAQFFLQLLVFRLESAWKREQAQGKSTGGAILGTTVRIVQQTDLVLLISALSFVVDTVGDFTFISAY